MAENSLSILLDNLLDQLGFSENDIKERICMLDRCTIARTVSARKIQKRDDIDRIFVGSQREGIGLQYINDTDVLQIFKSCYCFESNSLEDQKTRPDAWLELDSTRTHPGHYFLKAHGAFATICLYRDIQHFLIQRFGETFLSAKIFMAENDDMFATSNGYLGKQMVFKQRQGPSWPKSCNTFEKRYLASLLPITLNDNIDYVRGLPCICSTFLTKWSCRERKGDWPSKKTIQYVVDLPAFVVPVAQKGTAHNDLQWRLCFTLGEMYLLRTLNNTHMKVYVVLKFLAKYELQTVCPEISSFVMKNVLLWQAESTPFNDFRPDTLVMCIRKALEYLKECLQENNLPYYMMPERNLLLNKISPKQRRNVLRKLDHFKVTYFNNSLLNESHLLTNWLTKIGEEIYLGHFFSKVNNFQISVLNAVDLAIYFETLFYKRCYLSCLVYHMWTVVMPMTYMYGLNVLRNPLRYHIPLGIGVLGSFRKSVWVSKPTSYGENFLQITDSVQEIILPGDIIQVKERVKYTDRGKDISINVYWKLPEKITEENRENKHEHVKRTIKTKCDRYFYNTRTGLFVRMTWLGYRPFLAFMLVTAFCIHFHSSRFDISLAVCFADKCYFELLTTIIEILLVAVTMWKCRAWYRLDVLIQGHSTQGNEE
ncbi:uncharacterized protein LOC127860552 [Dreissena polymorpha]|uniref:Mab-21-like HhH/H2TH-like domain-containing protein n=1 Tax=Dreissena polymorpha TaxID=45954 RepID=A0A9D4BLT2_DREPO|nr:uncharacterized protein LOC127860552 [Dreissena polymorpha]KAH3699723.1 hypothetical protein DPMN_074683 [Dreissena polymorpha]